MIWDLNFYHLLGEHLLTGKTHTHCLFWVQNAPKYRVQSDEEVLGFIDNYVTCHLPDIDDPLYDTVLDVQSHSTRHSASCRKKGTACRFLFPKPPSNRTFIANPENADLITTEDHSVERIEDLYSKVSKNSDDYHTVSDLFHSLGLDQETFENLYLKTCGKTSVILERNLDELWINNYNDTLLRCWDANLDIQYVTDAYACVVYILSYISKSERELNALLSSLREEAELDDDARANYKKLGLMYLSKRE